MGLEEAMRLEIEELIEEKTALRAQLMGKTTAEAIKMAFDNGDSYLESVLVRAKRAEADRDALRAQLAAANERAEKAEERLDMATEFKVGFMASHPAHWSNEVLVQRREGWKLPKQPYMWAVKWNGNNLAKDGTWEYEPTPSSRDDEFYARCRFDSLQEAWDAAIAHIDAARGKE